MEYEDEDMDVQPFSAETVAEYIDEVEKLFTEQPDKRKKKEHAKWKLKINDMIAECNKRAKLNGNDTKLYHQLK